MSLMSKNIKLETFTTYYHKNYGPDKINWKDIAISMRILFISKKHHQKYNDLTNKYEVI